MSEKIKVIECLYEEINQLKQQKAEIEKRIEELENQGPETFEGILDMLDFDTDLEPFDDLNKITAHSELYHNLKRIELYVNKKFGGKIDWSNEQQIKFCPWYQSSNGAFGYNEATTAIDSPFALISMEAYKYFIKVTGEHLVNYFKTTH